jgi:hypothetical protein
MADVRTMPRRLRAPEPGVGAARAVAADRPLVVAVVVAGLVAYLGGVWLEPVAVHPHSGWDLVAEVATTGFLGLALGGALALFHGRGRLGFGLTAGAAWTLLALVVACPTSGHHAFGAWWAGQLALTLPYVTVATVAALSRRGPRRSRR